MSPAMYCWLSFGPFDFCRSQSLWPSLGRSSGPFCLFSLPLRQQHHPWSNVVRDQGASCRTIFAILLLEGQAVLLSSCPRRCPGQKIEVLWEVSKPESDPPSVPGGWGSGCGLGRISGLQCQPAPLQLHLGWEGKSPQCSRQEGGCANL